jgi:hypothetical protein
MLLGQTSIRIRKSTQEKLNTRRMEMTYNNVFHYNENLKKQNDKI